jgi:hypothetical protein
MISLPNPYEQGMSFDRHKAGAIFDLVMFAKFRLKYVKESYWYKVKHGEFPFESVARSFQTIGDSLFILGKVLRETTEQIKELSETMK